MPSVTISSKGEILRGGRRSGAATTTTTSWTSWLARLLALAALAAVLNPTAESFSSYLSHRSAWSFSSLRRSSYQRGDESQARPERRK